MQDKALAWFTVPAFAGVEVQILHPETWILYPDR
jgi:hypothetical protein